MPWVALHVPMNESFEHNRDKCKTMGTLLPSKNTCGHTNLLVRSFWKDESVAISEECVKRVSVAKPALPTEALTVPLWSADAGQIGSEKLAVSV